LANLGRGAISIPPVAYTSVRPSDFPQLKPRSRSSLERLPPLPSEQGCIQPRRPRLTECDNAAVMISEIEFLFNASYGAANLQVAASRWFPSREHRGNSGSVKLPAHQGINSNLLRLKASGQTGISWPNRCVSDTGSRALEMCLKTRS